MEISTVWENHEIHIVGLNIDITHPLMCEFLAQQTEQHQSAGAADCRKTKKSTNTRALEGADWRGRCGDALILRVSLWSAEKPVQWRTSLKYLARGKTGYVPPQWCTIEQAIDVIHHSGGKAVLAHPGRYNLSAKWLKKIGCAHLPEPPRRRDGSRAVPAIAQ